MLNASHVRTKRAAFDAASMSSTPASACGWLPTTPTLKPPSRAKPQTMFSAKCGCSSRKWPSSTTSRITRFMSYGFVASSGISSSSSGDSRSTASSGSSNGAACRFDCGRKLSR